MSITRIAVLGSGIMGHGIAQVSATAGYEVCMRDVDARFLERAMANMEKSLNRMIKVGKISQEEVPAVLERVRTTTDLKQAAEEADLVIEAIPEDFDLKKGTFRELDRFCRPFRQEER